VLELAQKNTLMKKKYIYIFGVMLFWWYALSAVGFYFTMPPVDEGMLLSAGRRLYMGELPYKNFFLYTPPFSVLLGKLCLELFGQYTSQRLVTIVLGFASVVLYVYYINRLFEGKKLNLQILATIIYIFVTLPVGFLFVHHSVSRFLFIVVLLLLMILLDSNKQKEKDKVAVFLGLTVFLCGFTNQVAGAYYFVSTFIVCFKTGGLRRAIKFSIPVIVGAILFLLWLVKNNTVNEYLDDTIIWVVNNYAVNNTYNLWHEQIYKIRTSSNVLIIIESTFILALKSSILIAAIWFLLIKKIPSRELIVLVFILLNMATLIQSFNSMNTYYIFALIVPLILLYLGCHKIVLVLMGLLMGFQTARSITYMPRVLQETISNGICDVKGVKLVCSEQIQEIKKLISAIDKRNIEINTIIGRSPVLYGLLNINNKSRLDQIFPPFVRTENLEEIARSIVGKCVITDFTDRYLFKSENARYGSTSQRDMSEGVMYESKKSEIENSLIFKIVNNNLILEYQTYGISCVPKEYGN
jgi:hypothetical protein